MSWDAWKWISASASDEIWPKDSCFVSWQHVKLQNLTLFHLQNKAYHQPRQGPEHDVKPTFQLAKAQTLVL